jgi:hypothetical protein
VAASAPTSRWNLSGSLGTDSSLHRRGCDRRRDARTARSRPPELIARSPIAGAIDATITVESSGVERSVDISTARFVDEFDGTMPHERHRCRLALPLTAGDNVVTVERDPKSRGEKPKGPNDSDLVLDAVEVGPVAER